MKTLLVVFIASSLLSACGKAVPALTAEATCQPTYIEQAQGLTLWANTEGVFIQSGCTGSETVQNSCNQVYNGTITCGQFVFTVTNGVAK